MGFVSENKSKLSMRIAGYLLACTLGFFLAGLADFPFRANVDGWGDIPVLDDKLVELKRDARKYDTMFLGTSRVLRHVDPKFFDARMAELGVKSSTFNMGIGGQDMVGLCYIIDALKDDPDLALKRVFIEPVFSNSIEYQKLLTRGVLKTHDFENTRVEVSNQIAFGNRLGWPYYRVAALHGLAFCYNRMGCGFWTTRAFGEGANNAVRMEVPTRAGYAELEDETDTKFLARNATFENATPMVMERYFSPPGEGLNREEAGADYARLFADILAPLQDAGAEIILIFPPRFTGSDISESMPAALRAAGLDWKVLRAPPEGKYSELYDPAYWFDMSHMGSNGARIYSRGLAEDYCATLEKGSAP